MFLYTFCIRFGYWYTFWVHFGYGIVQFSVPQKNSGNVYFLCFLNFFEVLKIAQFRIQNVPKTYTSTQNVYKTYIKTYIKQKKFLIGMVWKCEIVICSINLGSVVKFSELSELVNTN